MGVDVETMEPRTGQIARDDGSTLNEANLLTDLRTGFNELRTAEYTPILERKSTFGLSARRDVQTTTGSGSISQSAGEIKLSTGTTSGSTATLDTARPGTYLSGILALAGAAWRVGATPTGDLEARVGYFNDSDGFGVGVDATSMFVFLRKAGSETLVRRSDWHDPLDGTGASRFSISPTDLHIYRMPFRWYGGGPVRFFSDVVADGVYPHFELMEAVARQDAGPIFDQANLPVRCEVKNGTTASNLDLHIGGRQFGVFGRHKPSRRVNSEDRTGVTVGTTGYTPLISFRLKSGLNPRPVFPTAVVVNTNNDVLVKTFRGGTLTGASFGDPSDTTSAESAIEVDKSATDYTAGDKNWTGFGGGGSGNNTVGTKDDLPEIPLNQDDTYVLAAQAIDTEATVDAVFRWEEEW